MAALVLMGLIVYCSNRLFSPFTTLRTVTGKFVGFEYGDYSHTVIKTDQGNTISFFSRTSSEECFLALNKDKTLIVEYAETKTYFPEGAGYFPAKYIESIRIIGSEKHWEEGSPDSEKYDDSQIAKCNKMRNEFIYKQSAD